MHTQTVDNQGVGDYDDCAALHDHGDEAAKVTGDGDVTSMVQDQFEVRPALRVVTPEHPAVMPVVGLGGILARAGVNEALHDIERRLRERSASRAAAIAAAAAHILSAGGKRLRAALVVMAARLGHYDHERAAHAAVAVELLHAASLVHDDLVDHALQRRGQVTVHARWGDDAALMLGNYLFGVAARELAAEPDTRIIQFYASAAHTMVDGELHPVTQLTPFAVAREQYMRKIGAKTAVLFAAACRAGMAVGGGDAAQTEALGRFGYDLGLAFQIVDDVLDYTADEAALGKPAGNDLREGTLTLPLIIAAASQDARFGRLRAGVRPDPLHVAPLIAAVIEAGGTRAALHEAQRCLARALTHLDGFAPSPALRGLVELAQFVGERDR